MATSPYTGSARGTSGSTGNAKPGRLANPPSGGDIMNQTPPTTGGQPYKSTSPYAASPRCTEGK